MQVVLDTPAWILWAITATGLVALAGLYAHSLYRLVKEW